MTMMDKLRKPGRGKTITAYILFGSICVVFIFFGIVPHQMGFQQGGAAAVINKTHVSMADFTRQVQNLERQYSQQFQMLPEAQRQSQMTFLKKHALEQLIDSEVVYQAALRQGFVASDEEVRDYIAQIPAFQENGRFKRDNYTQYMQAMGLSAGQFEERIRKDIIVEKLREVFVASFEPVQGEEPLSQALASSKLDLEFVNFDQKRLENSIPVDEKEIAAFLADPQRLAEAKTHYDSIQSQFARPEEVRARHILFTRDAKKAETDTEVLKRLEDVRKTLKPENFAEVAKTASADPGSASQGGDLGYFSRGRMDKAFEEAVFKLEKGTVSAPVKTPFGYHLIMVEDKKPAMTKSFEEVKSEVAASLISRSRLQVQMDHLKALLKEGKTAEVSELFKKWNWKWESTGPFTLASGYIPKLGPGKDFLHAVSQHPQVGQLTPTVIEVGGEYYILRLKNLELAQGKLKPDPKADLNGMGLDNNPKFASIRRANEAFSNWVESEKKSAHIKRNANIL